MASDTLEDFATIPEIEQFRKGKKRIQNIQFFKPDRDGIPTISKSVTESDGILWQHPEFMAFGCATSRNAHKSKTFIMGMEKNLRKELLKAPEGFVILQPDFSAQEVWIAGALSQDKNQLNAAHEDPYVHFAKAGGYIPPDGTKDTHKKERDICKTVVLASFYGMGFDSLKNKLQLPEGVVQVLQQFNKVFYAQFFVWRDKFVKDHKNLRYAALLDGWPLLDNLDKHGNHKTCPCMNFPIQGTGAMIMRRVVDLFYQNRHRLNSNEVRLIFTLHDEFGVLCPKECEIEVQDFMRQIMQDACRFYFPKFDPPRVGFK